MTWASLVVQLNRTQTLLQPKNGRTPFGLLNNNLVPRKPNVSSTLLSKRPNKQGLTLMSSTHLISTASILMTKVLTPAILIWKNVFMV